jgi:hypothetical protein
MLRSNGTAMTVLAARRRRAEPQISLPPWFHGFVGGRDLLGARPVSGLILAAQIGHDSVAAAAALVGTLRPNFHRIAPISPQRDNARASTAVPRSIRSLPAAVLRILAIFSFVLTSKVSPAKGFSSGVGG